VEQPRPRQWLGSLGPGRSDALAILLQIHVGRRQPVDDRQPGGAALRAAVGPDRHADAMLERRVQVPLEEIGWFHDVHVGVDESEAVLHDVLLQDDRDAGSPLGCAVARTISGSGAESSGRPPLAAALDTWVRSAAVAFGAANGHEVHDACSVRGVQLRGETDSTDGPPPRMVAVRSRTPPAAGTRFIVGWLRVA